MSLKAGPISCRSPAHVPHNPAASRDRLTRLLLDLTVWRALAALSVPLQRLLAFYVFLGRSCFTLAADVQRLLWRALGWLAAPPRHPFIRRLGPYAVHFRRWHVTLGSILLATAASHLVRKLQERSDEAVRKRKQLRADMRNAEAYHEWSIAATKLDQLEQSDPKTSASRWQREVRLYDRKLLETRLAHMQKVRQRGDVQEMMFSLRADLVRNLGNMTNSDLHNNFPVVPQPIRDYIDEVKLQLRYITNCDNPAVLSVEEKLNFLRESRHAFGRTALVLSGGGSLGTFHLGVVKALFEHNLLPRVLSGSSVGSIVCAIIAVRTDDELQELFDRMAEFDLSFFSNSTLPQFIKHFIMKGTLQDHEVLQKRLRRLLGDLTFLDAYQLTGRILNVAVCAADTKEPPRLLNYLTAPHAVIWSAVACSSAFPGLFKPQDLLARNKDNQFVKFTAEPMRENTRRWRDGSLEEDLPMRGLSEMFNVNYFLVSQTNPHIVPVLTIKARINRQLADLCVNEVKHRCKQLHDVLPEWVSEVLPTYWLKVISQPWEGDVTMVLPSAYWQVKKAITNPDKGDLYQATKQGEAVTWAKLGAIQANCGIEITLDECLAEVTKSLQYTKAHRAAHRGMGSRIPSWIHLPGMNSANSSDYLPYRDGPPNVDLVAHAGSPSSVLQLPSDYPELGTPHNHANHSMANTLKAAVMTNGSTGLTSIDSHSEGSTDFLPPPDSMARSVRAVDDFPLAPNSAMDCCDTSVASYWKDTLLPLNRLSLDGTGSDASDDGLDFIAP